MPHAIILANKIGEKQKSHFLNCLFGGADKTWTGLYRLASRRSVRAARLRGEWVESRFCIPQAAGAVTG